MNSNVCTTVEMMFKFRASFSKTFLREKKCLCTKMIIVEAILFGIFSLLFYCLIQKRDMGGREE